MKLSKTQIAILSLIAANIIWGAASPIFKWSLQDIQPLTLAFLRFALSALIVLPFVIHRLKIKPEDIATLLFISVICLGLRIGYFMYGLKLAASINAPIISSATPIFLIIGSIALFHEKTSKRVMSGTLIGFLGILIIVLQPVLQDGFNTSLVGNIFFLVSMALGVIYTLLLKELAPKYHPLTLLFWTFAIASLALLPFAGFETVKSGIGTLFDNKALIGIVFAVLFPTILAYALQGYGLKIITAIEVGLFSYVDPFVAIAIANPLLGEHVTPAYIIGSVLLFLGIFIAEGRIHYHPLHLLKQKRSENFSLIPQTQPAPENSM